MTQPSDTARAAIAIFVKTPGQSPLKTRLAEGVGQTAALQFYRNSLAALKELLAAEPGLSPYWAVAEPDLPPEHPWQDFPILHQDQGGLGLRMASILTKLQPTYQKTLFIGSDTPQLSGDILREALVRLEENDVVFGPATDGGFYLLGTKVPISAEIFQQVSYSQADTMAQLAKELSRQHRVSTALPPLTDADTASDLSRIADQLAACRQLLPNQQVMATWLKDRLATPSL